MTKLLCILVALLLTVMGLLVVELHWGGDVNAGEDTERVEKSHRTRSGSLDDRAAVQRMLRQRPQ